MGRSGEGRSPFRVIWNKSAATAHNVYLLLYPKVALKRAFEEHPQLQAVVFRHLQSIDVKHLLGEGRVYGGGLYKLEPRELSRVPAGTLWRAVEEHYPPNLPFVEHEQLSLRW
jgi:hypothetical protein